MKTQSLLVAATLFVGRGIRPGSGSPIHLWSMTNFTSPREFFGDISSA